MMSRSFCAIRHFLNRKFIGDGTKIPLENTIFLFCFFCCQDNYLVNGHRNLGSSSSDSDLSDYYFLSLTKFYYHVF